MTTTEVLDGIDLVDRERAARLWDWPQHQAALNLGD